MVKVFPGELLVLTVLEKLVFLNCFDQQLINVNQKSDDDDDDEHDVGQNNWEKQAEIA